MINLLMVFFAKYLFVLIIILSIIYFITQSKETKKKLLLFACFSFPITLIIAIIAGKIYYDPRPFVVNHFIPLVNHAANNGFPSDHALISFAFASAIFIFNKKLSVVLFTLGIIVGMSRVYVGIHTPVDIIGSFSISIFVVFVLKLVFDKYQVSSKGK
jgi:undecaprenyl-diphosphatase